jgi:hypothetical protein
MIRWWILFIHGVSAYTGSLLKTDFSEIRVSKGFAETGPRAIFVAIILRFLTPAIALSNANSGMEVLPRYPVDVAEYRVMRRK